MRAYTVWFFWKDLLSDTFLIEFSFAMPGKSVVSKTRNFTSQHAAIEYLLIDKMTWFKICLEHYLNTCENENTNPENKYLFETCKQFSLTIEALTQPTQLIEICKRFLKGQPYFTKILPDQQNKHFKELENDLKQLLLFCQQETTN